MWTKESVQRLLSENDRAVVRAVVAIYDLQTDDEKASESTRKSNGVGFNQVDARRGAYYAGYIRDRGALTGKHLEIARKMMMKYWRQLSEIANAKAAPAPAVESVAHSATAAPQEFRPIETGEDVGNYMEEKMIYEEAANWR